MSDPFDRWGLPENATESEILVAYRRRVQKMHPDRAGNTPVQQELFCQLQADYDLLKVRDLREKLIAERVSRREANRFDSTSSFRSWSPDPTPDQMRSVFVDQPVRHVPAGSVYVDLKIPLDLAMRGGTRTVQIRVARPCGCIPGFFCPRCQNTGQLFGLSTVVLSWDAGILPGALLSVPGAGHQGSHENGDVLASVSWTDTNGWFWMDGALTKIATAPQNVWDFGHQWWFIAPSGIEGYIILPILKDKSNVRMKVDGLGVWNAITQKNDPAWIIFKRASWWNNGFWVLQQFVRAARSRWAARRKLR